MLLTTIDYPIAEGAIAFSTMREAGDPLDPYDGFNACHYTGDTPGHIESCRMELCHRLGITSDRLVIPRQTHSDNIAIIERQTPIPTNLPDTDGLVTNQSGIALCINTADCVAVLLADPKARVIAAVHSGWRGTVAKISGKAVEAMCLLGAEPRCITAFMGPSIGKECFEVGNEVAQIFHETFPGRSTVADTYHKPHIDLPAAIAATLTDAGLQEENINAPAACSMCRHSDFFSARRLGIKSGRTLSVIMLDP